MNDKPTISAPFEVKDKIAFNVLERDKYSLFTDPEVLAKGDALQPEEKEAYTREGEKFFAHMPTDEELKKISEQHPEKNPEVVVNEEISKKWGDDVLEPIARLRALLNSGFHPRGLNEMETSVLEQCYGTVWFENFGYNLGDLTYQPTVLHSPLALMANKWKNDQKRKH
jgi:hypothetical protein